MNAQIKCPNCREPFEVEIPLEQCLAFARCPTCRRLIKPKTGDCCVVCSYSEQKCPVSVLR